MEDSSKYALVSDRYKAVFVDGMVMILLAFIFSVILDQFTNVPEEVDMVLYVLAFFLYEPICVSTFGASVGHYSGNMKVVRESDESRKLNFFMAVIRYALKVVLGIISLFTVTKQNKGQAIHDMAAQSVVIFNEEAK